MSERVGQEPQAPDTFLCLPGPLTWQASAPVGSGDSNCDGIVDLADVVHLLNYLFKGGDPPGC